MPNTKSAERRVRNSARKQIANKSAKSRLKTLERNYLEAIKGGKKDEAQTALRAVTSAFDKAVKSGVVHKATANRKKSRLSTRLSAAAAPAA
jgi:small subunit ribosomal protein S20